MGRHGLTTLNLPPPPRPIQARESQSQDYDYVKMTLNEFLSANYPRTVDAGVGDAPSAAAVVEHGHRGWSYGCVQAIADRISGLPYFMTRGKKRLDSHPFLDLIEAGNYSKNGVLLNTGQSFLHQTVALLELGGNAYWFPERAASGKPFRLQQLTPDRMVVYVNEADWTVEYIWSGETLYPENVLHIKRPNPASMWVGASPIEAAAYAHDASLYSQIYQRNFFRNNARPDFVVILPQNMAANEEAAKRVWRMIQDRHQGLDRSHLPLVLGNGSDVKTLQITGADQAYLQAMNATRDLIHAIFCVPLAKRGLVADSNRANSEAADYTFDHNCILPRTAILASYLTAFSRRLFHDDAAFEFENPVARDVTAERAQEQFEIEMGLANRNEIRERHNLPPVEGGDVYLLKAGLIPAELAGASQQMAMDLQAAMAGRQQEPGAIEPPKEEPPPAAQKMIAGGNVKAMGDGDVLRMACRKGARREEAREELWNRKVARMTPKETAFKQDLADIFRKQQAQILAKLPEVYAPLAKSIDYGKPKASILKFLQGQKDAAGDLFDWRNEVGIFKRAAEDYIPSVALSEFNQAIVSLLSEGVPVEELPEAMSRWCDIRMSRYAKEVTDTTKDILNSIIRRSLADGDSVDTCAAKITARWEGMAAYRAQMIARTELNGVMNYGAMEGYRSTGIVARKEWGAAFDERTRSYENGDEFNHAVSEIVGIDEPFVGTGEPLDHPGDPAGSPGNIINCRCDSLPVIEGEEGEE